MSANSPGSEILQCSGNELGLMAPILGSAYLASHHAEWRDSGTEGFWLKPLYTDEWWGERTLLIKIDPGAFALPHSHAGEFEKIFVREGTFYDQDHCLVSGDYCCRSPEAVHSAGSETGGLVLLVYTRREAFPIAAKNWRESITVNAVNCFIVVAMRTF